MDILELVHPKRAILSDYVLQQTIGEGSFGRVKLAQMKNDRKYYAIKILKKIELIKLQQVDHILNEIKILTLVSHPFIVKTYGFTQDERYIYIVLEFVNGGELFTYLRSTVKFPIDQAIFYAGQIVLIFEYLHSKNIIYRDLKPENLLIDSEGYLKLVDFGFAKVCVKRTYTLCGTPEYIAPEILLNKGHGKPVDWWTFGIFIYEMIAGIPPFNDEDPMGIYQKIIKCKVKFPSSFPSNAKSLVKHLLVIDLSKRYGNLKNGVNDIKNHRFFKDFDFRLLINKKLKGPFIPKVSDEGDTVNFTTIGDSEGWVKPIHPNEDPFADW